MKLTIDQVKHVAKLANLPLTDEEEELYTDQLSNILEYIDQLNSVDTSRVEPTFNVSGQDTVMREDKSADGLSQDEALLNAPAKKDGFFVTKGVSSNE